MRGVAALAAIAAAALLLTAGCKTVPPSVIAGPGADAPWPEQRAALEKLDRYGLNGRVAVAAQGQGFSASLRYQQEPRRSNLALDGPLGIGGLHVELEGEGVTITTSRGEKLDGERARDELERRLGFELPLAELRWWLLGIPAPGEASVNQDAGSGEIRDFTQNGWRVSVNSRAAGLGFSLPQRLTAEREAVMSPTTWSAPAKLNLMLHVVGRRPDGYHELQTVFQLIDLCDRLEIEVRDDGVISRPRGPAGVPECDDLVVRAARALQAATGSRLGAEISIKKSIPIGGGLGGGSSDAATALVALNRMWGTGLSADRIAEIGVKLGADVPIFVTGRSAWAEGVGEKLTPVSLGTDSWFLVIFPGVSVPTAAVFQAAELTRNSPPTTMRGFLETGGRNDCEAVVRARFPAVAEALDWLARHGPARLTGTGSCVFAKYARVEDAERVAARVPDTWRAWVARGLDSSPLLEELAGRSNS
jgi:4-diphosphocytidyl-2-C-methyl-D-erythritol kinase